MQDPKNNYVNNDDDDNDDNDDNVGGSGTGGCGSNEASFDTTLDDTLSLSEFWQRPVGEIVYVHNLSEYGTRIGVLRDREVTYYIKPHGSYFIEENTSVNTTNKLYIAPMPPMPSLPTVPTFQPSFPPIHVLP